MRKFIKRPAIVLALIFMLIFVIILFKSYVNLLEDLSKSDRIDNVSVEKISEYEQELKSSVKPDQLKFFESTLNTRITLGY